MKIQHVLKKVALFVIPLILIGMIVQMLPIIRDLIAHGGNEESVVEQISSFGWRGVPALIALSALQVIIPFIPAPAVGILTSLSYGIFRGAILFLSGFALGNLFVMFFVREMHIIIRKKRKSKNGGEESALRERINKIKRPEIVAFFFTLVPFISSFGPYLFAETKVVQKKYIIAVILGNIPSTALYMLLGSHISHENYTGAIIVVAIAVVAIICAFIFRKKLMEKIFETSE